MFTEHILTIILKADDNGSLSKDCDMLTDSGYSTIQTIFRSVPKASIIKDKQLTCRAAKPRGK